MAASTAVKRLQAVIAPSMLASDFASLATEAESIVRSGADWLHMDVMVSLPIRRRMPTEASQLLHELSACSCSRGGRDSGFVVLQDGHFVPNLSIGAPVVKALRCHTSAFLDCHLMVSEPAKWVKDFHAAGASQITFHIEAVGAFAVGYCSAFECGGGCNR